MPVAVIEMPKGDDRRRHATYRKDGFVDLGPLKDVIPVNGGIMPVHYGYIKNTQNAKEKDEVDVLVFSDKRFATGDEVPIFPIALIRRADGDDKIVAVDSADSPVKRWEDIAQEERELVLAYFGHRYGIISVEGRDAADAYIRESAV